MYVRTIKRKNKDGSEVEYVQLAHNVRHPEKGYPKAEVVYSFGRRDQLDIEALQRLVNSIVSTGASLGRGSITVLETDKAPSARFRSLDRALELTLKPAYVWPDSKGHNGDDRAYRRPGTGLLFRDSSAFYPVLERDGSNSL